MVYGIAITLFMLWVLGLENNQHFGFITYGFLALVLLVVTANLLETRGRLETAKQAVKPKTFK
ncbi:MAG TPA: hypothetical protein VNZ67_07765 [bacterium]|jgi:hypothetical protein|nr:hypothetical protein [bacterium]